MHNEIYYFSGTGNSLYVAKKLHEVIPESKIIPIVSLLKKEIIKITSKQIGIIFPLQGPTFPNSIKQFLEKSDLSEVEYIYAIATRGGTTSCISKEINRILRKKRKKLNSHFHITVFNNDPKLLNKKGKDYEFRIPTKEEVIIRGDEIDNQIQYIKEIIIEKKDHNKQDKTYEFKYGFFLERLILFATRLMESKSIKDYFYINSSCIGCGLCEKICLSNRIKMIKEKPHWDDNILCYMCYACINYCPKESIQINSKWYMKSYTTEQGRYSHPYAKAEEIKNQKNKELR